MDNLLENYYTVISILVVYHSFSLQSWLDKLQNNEQYTDDIKSNTGIGDLLRERAIKKAVGDFKNFPYFQIILFFISTLILSLLIINISNKSVNMQVIKNLSMYHYILPLIVLWLIFIIVTIGAYLKGKNILNKLITKLM